MILPLAAAFFAFVLFFFRVMQIQTRVQEALVYSSRKSACEACATDSAAVIFASAEAYFRKELRSCEWIERYVAGGSLGISLIRSEVSENSVYLRSDYFIKFPLNYFGKRKMHVFQSSKSQKWIGDCDKTAPEDYVYVTETGTVYHLDRGCHYIDLSIHKVKSIDLTALRSKNEHKYYACEECAAKNSNCEFVYITDYGTRYHVNLGCGGLKRTVYLVPMSEVGGRHACSKCGG